MAADIIRVVFHGYGAEESCAQSAPIIVSLTHQVPTTDTETDGALAADVDWRRRQEDDPAIRRIIELKQVGQKPPSVNQEVPEVQALFREWARLKLCDGVLVRVRYTNGQTVNQLVLPPKNHHSALYGLHDRMGHLGVDRTIDLARDRFYWPKMADDIQSWIPNCKGCVCRKQPERKGSPLISIKTTQPMELVCMDYLTLEISKGGYENILVITDHFTRYAQAIPTRNQQFIVHYGFPAQLHSDQGRNFESKVIRGLCKVAGMRKSRTTLYHPMGNGMCERFNQALLSMLGTLSTDAKADWKSHVAPLVHAYNATKHDSIKCSPFSLMFGREPRLPVDVAMGLPQQKETPSKDYAAALQERLRHAYEVAGACADEAAERQRRNYNTKVHAAIVAAGDRVLVKSVGKQGKNKLGDVWEEEPYLVHSQPNRDLPVYVVKREDGTGRTRTLRRNMLLPVGHLKFHHDEGRCLPERRKPSRKTLRRPPTTESDSSSLYLLRMRSGYP